MNEVIGEFKLEQIMLVDDDADDRDLFAEAIAFVNPTLEIVMKRNGEEMIQHLQVADRLPDLIFLDLNMPRLNGKEALHAIQKDQRWKNIPVIIYTTSLNPLDIDETYNAGARHFMRKPNSFEALKELLNSILFADPIKLKSRTKEQFIISPKLTMEFE
jgi:CheY-like chemotaxis protein